MPRNVTPHTARCDGVHPMGVLCRAPDRARVATSSAPVTPFRPWVLERRAGNLRRRAVRLGGYPTCRGVEGNPTQRRVVLLQEPRQRPRGAADVDRLSVFGAKACAGPGNCRRIGKRGSGLPPRSAVSQCRSSSLPTAISNLARSTRLLNGTSNLFLPMLASRGPCRCSTAPRSCSLCVSR